MSRRARGAGAAGFSLIELMVVVAIVSILAVGATLVLPRQGAGERAQAALLADARDMRLGAMLSGDDHGLSRAGDGWQRERRVEGAWVVLSRAGAGIAADTGRIVFSSDGRVGGGAFRLTDGTTCAPGGGAVTCGAGG